MHQDLSDQVAREQQTLPVLDTYTGAAKVVGRTVQVQGEDIVPAGVSA